MLLSIIIATRHRETLLWETVQKAMDVLKLKPNKAELIIVNDGDNNLVPPADFENKLRIINNPNHSVAKARNLGVRHAIGQVLLFLDDDMWLTAKALEWILANLEKIETEQVVYNLNWEYPTELIEQLNQTKVGLYILAANYHSLWGRLHRSDQIPNGGDLEIKGVGSCSLVLSKKLFNQIGGYNESLVFQGEDNDLGYRLTAQGVKIYACFDVLLYHNHADRTTLSGYLDREFNGYLSEAKGVKQGILTSASFSYSRVKALALTCMSPFRSLLFQIVENTPVKGFFTKFNNKLIGWLAAIQKFKAYKQVFNEK